MWVCQQRLGSAGGIWTFPFLTRGCHCGSGSSDNLPTIPGGWTVVVKQVLGLFREQGRRLPRGRSLPFAQQPVARAGFLSSVPRSRWTMWLGALPVPGLVCVHESISSPCILCLRQPSLQVRGFRSHLDPSPARVTVISETTSHSHAGLIFKLRR